MMRSRRRRVGPLLAVVVLAVAVVLVARSAAGGADGQRLHLIFPDAGQLIAGDLVEVGGVSAGKIERLQLTHDGLADVVVRVTDPAFLPLRRGTTASIGTVGLSGVTNRFVALEPSPRGAALPDDATIGMQDTRPLVDIDAVLDSITPSVRRSIRSGLRDTVPVLDGNVANTRRTLRAAASSLQRVGAFARQLTADRDAFSGLLSSGATVATTLGDRERDLGEGVRTTATTFRALARGRRALGEALQVAPSALRRASRFLVLLRPTLASLDPVLRDARPVAMPLAAVLRGAVPTADAATPAVRGLRAALPDVRAALDQLPPLARDGLPGLTSADRALTASLPVLAGLRPYAQDVVQGLLRGLGGSSGFNYDANGQFGRITLGLPISTALTSVIGTDLSTLRPDTLTGQTSKCPGSAAQPTADRSNVVRPTTVPCDPAQVPR